MAELKDSGQRTQFESGAVRDLSVEKGRMDLLPLYECAQFVRFMSDETHKQAAASIGTSANDAIILKVMLEEIETLLNSYQDIKKTYDKSPSDCTSRLLILENHIFSCIGMIMFHDKYKRFEGNVETLILELAKHFEDGANKYGDNNWRKGIPLYRYIDSALRHFVKYSRGDTDEPHDRAFVWNLMCFLWTFLNIPGIEADGKVEEQEE